MKYFIIAGFATSICQVNTNMKMISKQINLCFNLYAG